MKLKKVISFYIGLYNSIILTQDEAKNLYAMGDYTDARLLYRASRDSFSGAVYHNLSSVPNTVAIIKSDNNYVFGGFTSIGMNKTRGWYKDPTAYIFSLRRNGTSNNVQLRSGGQSQDQPGAYALFIDTRFGPYFGFYDIYICDQSNSISQSSSNLCYTYDCPVECSRSSTICSTSYLAGSATGWYTIEIEVFQMLSPVTTTVQPG
jgi:hypothetical protein